MAEGAEITIVRERRPSRLEKLTGKRAWLAALALSSLFLAFASGLPWGPAVAAAVACLGLWCGRKAWELADYDLARLLVLGACARGRGVETSPDVDPGVSRALEVSPLAERGDWARLAPDTPLRRVARLLASSDVGADVTNAEARFADDRSRVLEELSAAASYAIAASAALAFAAAALPALAGSPGAVAAALPLALLAAFAPLAKGWPLAVAAPSAALAAALPLLFSVSLPLAVAALAALAGVGFYSSWRSSRELGAALRACYAISSSALPPEEAAGALRYEDERVGRYLERPPKFNAVARSFFELLRKRALPKRALAFAEWVLERAQKGWSPKLSCVALLVIAPFITLVLLTIVNLISSALAAIQPLQIVVQPSQPLQPQQVPTLPDIALESFLRAVEPSFLTLPTIYAALALLYDKNFAGHHASLISIALACLLSLSAQLIPSLIA